MLRTFIEIQLFTKRWENIGFYTKNEQDNLTAEEKNNLKRLVKSLKDEVARNWR